MSDFTHYHIAMTAGQLIVMSAETARNMADGPNAGGVSECRKITCLKFCSYTEVTCHVATGTDDTSESCWNCGAPYTGPQDCEWLIDQLAREAIEMCEAILS